MKQPDNFKIMVACESVRKNMVAGIQTQDRRPIKPQPPEDAMMVDYHDSDYLVEELRGKVSWFVPAAEELWPCNREDAIKASYPASSIVGMAEPCQIIKVGSHRWVHFQYKDDGKKDSLYLPQADWNQLMIRKTYIKADKMKEPLLPVTSARFMYKSLCRHFFEVTDVLVQRVQEISTADVKREGFEL